MVELAGLIVCGGRSRRMGRSKAWLSYGDETLLERVARRIRPAVGLLAVVGSRDLELPPLPSDVLRLADGVEDEGPLEGVAVGLEALRAQATHAFVVACDMPFISQSFARRLHALVDEDGAVPRSGGRTHPLAAVYATSTAERVRALRDAGERRATALSTALRVRFVTDETLLDDDELRTDDPTLRALLNVNTLEDYGDSLAEFSARSRR